MPDINKLRYHEGEMIILDINSCSNLNMLQGQLALLKKAYTYLLDKKLINPNLKR